MFYFQANPLVGMCPRIKCTGDKHCVVLCGIVHDPENCKQANYQMGVNKSFLKCNIVV